MGRNTLPTTSWSEIRRALTRHKGQATLVFLVAVGAAVVGTMLTPRVYRSEAMLLVRLGRENAVLDTTATAGGDRFVSVPMSREDEINSVVEVLKSRALAEKVVDDLGPDAILAHHASTADQHLATADGAGRWVAQAGTAVQNARTVARDVTRQVSSTAELTDRDRAIVTCLRSFDVQAVRRSNIIQLGYDARSPQLGQAVAARFVDVFRDEHVRIHRSAGSHEFFAHQAAKLHGDLDRREKELRDLKNETGLASPEEQRKLLVARISAMEADVLRIDAVRAASQAKVAALREKLANLPATQVALEDNGYGNEGTDRMRNQLYALQVQEEEAAADYTDQHPKMRELRQRNAEAKQLLAAEERTRKHVSIAPNRLYQEAQLALLAEEPVLVALQAQATELRTQMAGVSRSLVKLNENERRIVKLQRDVALDEASYRKYAAGLEQSRFDAALEEQRISNISIVQTASYDPNPIFPHVMLNLALGLLAGICGGVALALTLERFGRTVRSREDVERDLSLPALAAIPRFTPKQAAAAERR